MPTLHIINLYLTKKSLTGVTSGAGTVYPSEAPGVRVTRSLVLCVFFSSLFVFLYFFFLAVALSVLLRYTDSDYPYGVFKLFF